MNDCFKVRVGVVIIDEENRLLLVRQNRRSFWVLPGGTLEKGETLAECAIREMKEETNLDIQLGSLLYVGDFFASKDRQVVDIVFLGHLQPGGILQKETNENIDEIGFFTRQEIELLTLKPEEIFKPILDLWSSKQWPVYTATYLGGYSV